MKHLLYFFSIIVPLCSIIYAPCLSSDSKRGTKRTAQEMSLIAEDNPLEQTNSESLAKRIRCSSEISYSRSTEQRKHIRRREMKLLKTAQDKESLSSLQCPTCLQKFNGTANALDHYLAVHLQELYSCVSCGKNMAWSAFKAHRCGNPTKRRTALSKPTIPEWHKQKIQEIKKLTKTEVRTQQVQQGLLPSTCPICLFVCRGRDTLPSHYLHKHGGNAGMHTCKQCNASLGWKVFTTHICSHDAHRSSTGALEETKKPTLSIHSDSQAEFLKPGSALAMLPMEPLAAIPENSI